MKSSKMEIDDSSRNVFLDVVEDLSHHGAIGMIIGCTEIWPLIDQGNTRLTVPDTTAFYAQS